MKKRLTFLVLLALLGAFVFSLEGCGDKVEDPCKGKEPISADFSIGSKVLGEDTVIVADTILAGSQIVFESKSKIDYEKYEWKIGGETRVFNTKKVSLFFQSDLPSQTIEVKLKVQDSFIRRCFPSTNGMDSLLKRFVIVSSGTSVVFGNYEGYLEENPSSRFVVSVQYCNPITKSFICTNNIDKGCNNKLYTSDPYPYINDFTLTYRALRIGGPNSFNFFNAATSYPNLNCNDPKGWLYFGNSINDVIISYTTAIYPNTKTRYKHKFIGKRLK